MSWWNPFGWSGNTAEDRPEGIWGAPPAAYRPQPMLGEGSVVEEAVGRHAPEAHPMQTEVSRAYGTAGTGFGAPAPPIRSSGARSMASLQGHHAASSTPAAPGLIDGMGGGFGS